MTETHISLSNIISVNTTYGESSPLLTHDGLIESILRVMWGPRAYDERQAFDMLGGFGFAARRRARRRNIWARAVAIAERVGHGDVMEPIRVHLDFITVPLSSVDDVERIFSPNQRALASAIRLPADKVFGTLAHSAGLVTVAWETPTIREQFVCLNCDAEHDGVDWHPNHADDIWCIYYEDP